MSEDNEAPKGPDLAAGLAIAEVEDGEPIGGHVGDKSVVLVRRGQEFFAIGGTCTHYSGPLAEGIVVGEIIRCPWHHACFNLRTGESTCAPALDPVSRWDVEVRDDRVRVTRERENPDGATPIARDGQQPLPPSSTDRQRIVLVGAGAAAEAAAEMLRRSGFGGPLTMIGAEKSGPVDRPNLSKDYLAGNADPAWIPLRPPEFYDKHRITLMRGARVESIDVKSKHVVVGGQQHPYDQLLLATGADPVKLPLPGGEMPHVYYLRTKDDSEAIIDASTKSKRALVMGASFIGLEVAASLRERKVEVCVVAPEAVPLEKVLGAELGGYVRSLHEEHGVQFKLGRTAKQVEEHRVLLDNGEYVDANLVVIGVGVKPVVDLAEKAGLRVDKGVVVDEFLETSTPDIFAAGDIAKWPDVRTGQLTRVEHWVHAERMGQAAARNMLREKNARERFRDMPFFWSAHYDTTIRYVGNAPEWDEARMHGDIRAKNAAVSYRKGGRILAVATIGRDQQCLQAEEAMARDDDRALAQLLET
jgi:NADPH-dependent 2,4-dienoyl-CoA reductase/sulfur reductase-like enzyme/nitrite reductase/ring-hydroxylating ferredoxin subunit